MATSKKTDPFKEQKDRMMVRVKAMGAERAFYEQGWNDALRDGLPVLMQSETFQDALRLLTTRILNGTTAWENPLGEPIIARQYIENVVKQVVEEEVLKRVDFDAIHINMKAPTIQS